MFMDKLSIMVVDDTPENLKLLRSILINSGYAVRVMPEAALALESISTQAPDLILLDITMPQMSGFEMCRNLKTNPKFKNIPVIFISAKIELKDKIEAFAVGGVDYITKPFQEAEVLARVNTHLTLAVTQRELKEKNEELKRLAITDRLTGLYNRLKLDESLTYEFERITRSYKPFSLILLDIDHFKKVNDQHGHQTGDIVLVEMAKVLTESIRKTDILGRWGGEEFLIICPETSKEGAKNLAEKLRKTIEGNPFQFMNSLTSSVGVATYRKHDTITNLIERADKALYTAKNNGRNRIEMEETL